MRLMLALAVIAFPTLLSATTCDPEWRSQYRNEVRKAVRERHAALREAYRERQYARVEEQRVRREFRREMDRERREMLRDFRRQQRVFRSDRVF
jgi:hypothetical protein